MLVILSRCFLYSNLRELEAELRPSADYMAGHGFEYQPALFIDEGMRRIAVSWLVEVSCESCLHQETLFLATSLLDRFLSITTVSISSSSESFSKA